MKRYIYTERRFNKYKNILTDHVYEVYGYDCFLKKDIKIINNRGRIYLPLFTADDVICGLINMNEEYEISTIYLKDGSKDYTYNSFIIKFI